MARSRAALVLADTHLTAATLDRLPAEVWDLAEQAGTVLHAGDVVDPALLRELRARAEVHAVLGNNDDALVGVLPERLEVLVHGCPVALVHDSGPTAGREARLARWFPDAAVVVFGHSHAPLVATGPGGQLLCNPGSPTHRRRQPVHSVAWLEVDGRGRPSASLRWVGPLAGSVSP